MLTMEKTIQAIPSPIVIIMDAKRGDIGNSSRMYAKAFYEYYAADSLTLNPYMGYDSLKPFLDYKDKLNFILCLTSNPGARDFQLSPSRQPLYLKVAEMIHSWNKKAHCGLVIGGTYPTNLKNLRNRYPQAIFLIPGIGRQQGNLRKVVTLGKNKNGTGLLINASRSILYASVDKNFDTSARNETLRLYAKIAQCMEFFVFGVFLYRFHYPVKEKSKTLGKIFIFVLFWAVLDELHQFLIPGRTPDILDVGADTLGFLLFAAFSYFNYK